MHAKPRTLVVTRLRYTLAARREFPGPKRRILDAAAPISH